MTMPTLSHEQLAAALAMRAKGTPWDDIGKKFHVDGQTIRRRLDPRYAAKCRERWNEADRKRRSTVKAKPPELRRISTGFRPSEEEFRAAQSLIPPEHTDITALLMGDPRKGRSALDKRAGGPS